LAIKSILLGAICEERAPSETVFNYAVDFAAQFKAHLAIGLCVPKIEIATSLPVSSVRGLVSGANQERGGLAQSVSEKYLAAAKLAGVTASSRIFQAGYTTARDQLTRLARVNDLTVLQGSDGALSLEKDLTEECLFNSGRPVLVVPPKGNAAFALKRIIVAWDGSARAARAAGDAMQLLAAAETVAVVSVTGDARDGKTIRGAELAEHLSRHCRDVTVSEIAAKGGDVAATLAAEAKTSNADLLVMGGFGHARFKEMLLGGVTQSMLSRPTLPVFMSY